MVLLTLKQFHFQNVKSISDTKSEIISILEICCDRLVDLFHRWQVSCGHTMGMLLPVTMEHFNGRG